MNFQSVISIVIAFAVSVALGPALIPLLRKLKVGQTIRTEGPKEHLAKNGTPTMGGVLIIAGMIIPVAIFAMKYPRILPVFALTLGFGIVGFIDDYIKVVLKRSLGLKAWQKMGLQILITGGFLAYIIFCTDISLAMKIPFLEGKYIDLGWWMIPIMFIVILGTDTGANFTDGLDGLASCVTAVITFFLMISSSIIGGGIEPLCGAMLGALLGFLMFNFYPAKVFMGDTGSLAIGGFVAGAAIVLGQPLMLVIIAFIYVAEVASVILQVSYFKLTKGKRLFKMAPIHHHFELKGMKETKVVAMFTIITVLLCAVAFLGVW